MSETEARRSINDEYLANAIAWLNCRLRRLAEGPADEAAPGTPATATALALVTTAPPVAPPAVPVVPPKPAGQNWLSDLLRFGRAGASNLPSSSTPAAGGLSVSTLSADDLRVPREPALPAPSLATAFAALLADGSQTRDWEAEGFEAPALLVLQELLGLSDFERETLLLCVAVEIDRTSQALCARAQGGLRSYPTFALAMDLFDDWDWGALSPERPLFYWRLIEVTQSHGEPLVNSSLRADERIVSYIKGVSYLDDRLAPFLSPVASPLAQPSDEQESDLAPSQQILADDIFLDLRADERMPVVQLVGIETPAKQRVAAEVGQRLGIRLYSLSAAALPQLPAELDNWICLWNRETLLLGAGLVVDVGDLDDRGAREGTTGSLLSLLSRLNSLTFLLCREPWGRLGGETLIYEVEKPLPFEQAEVWAHELGSMAGESPARLAGQFSLDVREIRTIVARQAMLDETDLPSLWQACLRQSRPRLDLLAQRVVSRAGWDDIVLPQASADLLQQIAAQVEQRIRVYDEWGFRRKMSRGLGISVLFDGESGTGKTMAAEVLANQLDLDLYRIDLSAVISKYIGETEKNLRRLFDAAEESGAILFFDEADAIFGRRSEVKDSHDRYANIEVNYLLQRMEAFGGLAILATNMRSALDQAFVRRLRFIVKFPVPAAAERALIWTKAFPVETPLEQDDAIERLDFERLAKVNMTGGSISNAALNAAFLASRAGMNVTMSLAVLAVQTELKKMDRVVQPI